MKYWVETEKVIDKSTTINNNNKNNRSLDKQPANLDPDISRSCYVSRTLWLHNDGTVNKVCRTSIKHEYYAPNKLK